MKKHLFILICALFLTACAESSDSASEKRVTETVTTTTQNTTAGQTQSSAQPQSSSPEQKQTTFTMYIGDEKVNVSWEDNESVRQLKELVRDKKLTIEMSKYGGFEQVGSIGKSISSDDEQIKTEPGDIMLYSAGKIVIFYGSNSWDYTRLGRITGKSDDELEELLGSKDTTITLSFE